MSTGRLAALAILVGILSGLLTMAVHPTGHDVMRNAAAGASNDLNAGAHALALVGQALLLTGLLGFVYTLQRGRTLGVLGFVCYALAAGCVIIAAVASGFLAVSTVRGFEAADAAAQLQMRSALRYTGLINQAFAKANVLYGSLALLAWSGALLREHPRRPVLASYGVLCAVLTLVGIGTGVLRLDIHGYGLVVLTQGVFFLALARSLWVMTDDRSQVPRYT